MARGEALATELGARTNLHIPHAIAFADFLDDERERIARPLLLAAELELDVANRAVNKRSDFNGCALRPKQTGDVADTGFEEFFGLAKITSVDSHGRRARCGRY